MTAAAMHGTNIATGWLALLIMLAWFGLACLVVVLVCFMWTGSMRRRAERARRRRGMARSGPLPEETYRSFREPFDREHLPESGLSDEQLDRWPVLDREPRP